MYFNMDQLDWFNIFLQKAYCFTTSYGHDLHVLQRVKYVSVESASQLGDVFHPNILSSILELYDLGLQPLRVK